MSKLRAVTVVSIAIAVYALLIAYHLTHGQTNVVEYFAMVEPKTKVTIYLPRGYWEFYCQLHALRF